MTTEHLLKAYRHHALNPDAIAIEDRQGQSWTHQQLGQMSLRWASYMEEVHHVGPQDVVALAMGRCAEHIIGLLAVWHLGAIALPLDLTQSTERLQYILNQTHTKLVLTKDNLPNLSCAQGWPEPTHFKTRASTPCALDDLAYIIYTSGSTGTPKGVEVTHRGLVPLLCAQIQAFELQFGSRVLWLTSPCFDASLSDIGTALISGATIVIDEQVSPRHLGPHLQRHRVTHIDYPPGLLAQVPIESIPSCLEVVIIGGEACPVDVVRQWASRVKLVNVYGPTEATICVSAITCDTQWSEPLLGQPLAQMGWVVLDEHDIPALPNTPGHLHLHGPGLARGYVNRPDLDQRAFVIMDGIRHYRTGDRVVMDDAGRVCFIGRIDRQIKLRGMRIELADIEHHLLKLDGIDAAVVLKREHAQQPLLVAFVEGQQTNTNNIRAQLKQALPGWMLPAVIVHMNPLPRNHAQKPDTQALLNHPITFDVKPHTPHHIWKRTFCQIWKEVLMLPELTEGTNLHALGANSLDIMDVVTRGQHHGWFTAPALWQTHHTIEDAYARWCQTTPPSRVSATMIRADVTSTPLPKITIKTTPPNPTHILLTGSTGRLGSQLAKQWLIDGKHIHAPIRATNEAHIRSRAHKAMGQLAEHPNLHLYRADITQPQLMLPTAQWQHLGHCVDAIVHSAAKVHMIDTYEALKQTNVMSLKPLIELMHQGKPKALHHLSTLSVFVATNQREGVALETDQLHHTQWIDGGYAQSKWAAEVALFDAMTNNPDAPIWLHRLGLVVGDPTDFLQVFCRGILEMGNIPILTNDTLRIDITPAEQACQTLRCLVENSPPQTYHISSSEGLPVRKLLDALADTFGLPSLNISKWRTHHHQHPPQTPNSIAAFLAMCRLISPDEDALMRWRAMDLFQTTRITFDRTHTQHALEQHNLSLPQDSHKNWIKTILDQLQDI